MCYALIGYVMCRTCRRRIRETPAGVSLCKQACGKYLSKYSTDAKDVRWAECPVCLDKRLVMEETARKLNLRQVRG